MSQRKIYFVRHSIRDLSVQEDEIAPLTAEGLKKAEYLKDFFDDNIQFIYSSPFKRTVDTIQPTANKLGLKIHLHPLLQERYIGKWVENFDQYAHQQWYDFDYKLPNGESLNDVKNRVVTGFWEIVNNTHGDIIITGHGTSFSVLFYSLTDGRFNYDDFKKMTMPDIYCYELDSKKLIRIDTY